MPELRKTTQRIPAGSAVLHLARMFGPDWYRAHGQGD